MPEIACKTCGEVSSSLAKWKKHMGQAHNGWSEEELAEALGATSSEGDVRARMQAFAKTGAGGVPGVAQETESPPTSSATPPPAPTPGLPGERRVRATPKKFKRLISSIPKGILENQKIDLDKEDNETLDEVGEFLTDIFGIEFSVPGSKVLIESRFWALAWVCGVCFLVYVKHRFTELFGEKFSKLFTKEEELSGTESVDTLDQQAAEKVT